MDNLKLLTTKLELLSYFLLVTDACGSFVKTLDIDQLFQVWFDVNLIQSYILERKKYSPVNTPAKKIGLTFEHLFFHSFCC